MSKLFLDLGITKRYLWGLVELRRSADISDIEKYRYSKRGPKVVILHDNVSGNILQTNNFDTSSPVWKLVKIKTRALFFRFTFFMPGAVDRFIRWDSVEEFISIKTHYEKEVEGMIVPPPL